MIYTNFKLNCLNFKPNFYSSKYLVLNSKLGKINFNTYTYTITISISINTSISIRVGVNYILM